MERHEKAEAELRQSLEAQRQEVERQKQKLQDRDKEVARLQYQRQIAEARAKELETSTSFQLGRAVVEALVHPSPALWALPGRLVRIALDRKKRQQAPQKRQQAPQPEPDENEKISVIMTTYNSADYVADAIRSILDQSHRNLELIVVDDASTDGTFELLREHARVDNRVRPFNCLENRGTYWCKNFGITKATGTYLTFQDSDDVSDPNRLDAQLKELSKDPNAVAATCNYVRRSPNGELIRNRGRLERMAIMAPMFKKDAVIDTVGYYDSVRTSADDEMYHRLSLVFGKNKIRHVDRTLYVASYREGSLTTALDQVDLSVEEKAGDLSFLGPDRRKYVYSYGEWHKSLKKGDEVPYMAFPLLRRRFPAPNCLLIDSKPAEEYVTASVASFAAREDSLKQAVASILPQIDRLNVYLNDYDAVPEFLRHPKITVARSQEHEDLRDNGKFFFLRNVAVGYHFTIDDDIIYPPNYVQHLILKILQYRKRAVVGIHGVTFADPIERFYKDRKVSVFWGGLNVDRVVNLLGSGTVAYHTSTVELDFKDFKVPGMGDLWLAVAAKRQKVPMIAVARAPKWLTSVQQNHAGLYEEFVGNDEIQTEVAVGEGPWDFKSMARNYFALADYFLSNFSTEALRSNEVDVEFWQRFAHIIHEGRDLKPAKRAVKSIDKSQTTAGYDEKYRRGLWSYNYDLERKRLEGTLNVIGLKGGKGLELGCGEGFHAKLLVDLGFTVTANDLSRVAIERATEAYPEVDFIHGDSAKLIRQLEPESFDLVAVRGHSWYHYELDGMNRKGQDVAALTGEIFRLIRPGGFFVLFIKTDFTGTDTDGGVVNNRYGDYLDLFRRFGEVVRVTDWSGTPLENEEAALKSGFNIAISTRKPEQAL